MKDAGAFIHALQSRTSMPGVFNPWRDTDPNYDVPDGPQLRSKHLKEYLETRLETAKYVLVAEALGYQGGKFSGIAMTSERMITGHHKQIPHHYVIPGMAGTRTSQLRSDMNRTQRAMGMTEPTATIVWTTMLSLGAAPDEFVLWNAFPFHPFRSNNQTLHNRTGTELTPAERMTGQRYLQAFFALFPSDAVIAVGDIAEQSLTAIGVQPACKAKHPSNGGKPEFVKAITAYLKTHPPN